MGRRCRGAALVLAALAPVAALAKPPVRKTEHFVRAVFHPRGGLAAVAARALRRRPPCAQISGNLVFGMLTDGGGTDEPPYTTPEQLAAAAALETVAAAHSMAFVVSAGGNFLPSGLPVGGVGSAASDARFTGSWEDVYSGPALSSITWYATGGYTDWDGNVTAERAYTLGPSSRWQYPTLWQSFTFETVQALPPAWPPSGRCGGRRRGGPRHAPLGKP